MADRAMDTLQPELWPRNSVQESRVCNGTRHTWVNTRRELRRKEKAQAGAEMQTRRLRWWRMVCLRLERGKFSFHFCVSTLSLQCSKTCGEGVTEREVVCLDDHFNTTNTCPSQAKLSDSKPCSIVTRGCSKIEEQAMVHDEVDYSLNIVARENAFKGDVNRV